MSLFAKRESWCTIIDGQVTDLAYGKDYAEGCYVEWGSITKTATALAVAALVGGGRLSYDDPANRYVAGRLPDSVSVGGLVTHTSGLPRVHAGMSAGISGDPYAGTDAAFLDQYLQSFTSHMLEQPGVQAYSNLGYAVLGRVVEVVNQTSWVDAVQQLALAPLGVHHVVVDPPGDRVAAVLGFNRRPRTPWAVAGSAYAPAGALWSTVPTLAQFGWAVLEQGGHDSPHSGWQRDRNAFWHNGQTRDAGACLVLVPNRRLVVATHTLARLPGAADALARSIVESHTAVA